MNHLNDEQLNERIETFLARKHQQYPQLKLRKTDKQTTVSMGTVVFDKLVEFMSNLHMLRYVR